MKARVADAYVAYMTTVLDFFEPYSAEITGGVSRPGLCCIANTLNRDHYPRIHALYLARGYRFVSLATALEIRSPTPTPMCRASRIVVASLDGR